MANSSVPKFPFNDNARDSVYKDSSAIIYSKELAIQFLRSHWMIAQADPTNEFRLYPTLDRIFNDLAITHFHKVQDDIVLQVHNQAYFGKKAKPKNNKYRLPDLAVFMFSFKTGKLSLLFWFETKAILRNPSHLKSDIREQRFLAMARFPHVISQLRLQVAKASDSFENIEAEETIRLGVQIGFFFSVLLFNLEKEKQFRKLERASTLVTPVRNKPRSKKRRLEDTDSETDGSSIEDSDTDSQSDVGETLTENTEDPSFLDNIDVPDLLYYNEPLIIVDDSDTITDLNPLFCFFIGDIMKKNDFGWQPSYLKLSDDFDPETADKHDVGPGVLDIRRAYSKKILSHRAERKAIREVDREEPDTLPRGDGMYSPPRKTRLRRSTPTSPTPSARELRSKTRET
ncbi:hypothetical protein EV360DRAFT_70077 [Lentinula raphanica]|nr:hypothetical protein EV360DRAFT_70077 [Lentinula raphanica]